MKKVKTFIPHFSKHRIREKNKMYIVEVPYLYFFWKPLKIKIITNSVIDFEMIAEFDNKIELNDFIKYKVFNYKRI